MSEQPTQSDLATDGRCPLWPPFVRAPEAARTVYLVTLAAACGPLLAGIVFFGWRAAGVAAISVFSCAAIERIYYRVTRTPALLGRSHAYLTGLLLALTLPPFAPWYVPVIGAAFAIIVGKAVFGGVGHFLWQPALLGRLAVAVIFATPALHTNLNPATWPLLAQSHLVVGDCTSHAAEPPRHYAQWLGSRAPEGKDAFLLTPPSRTLAGLTNRDDPPFSGLCRPADVPQARPAVLTSLPPLSDLLCGPRPGGIGETCAVVIVVAGLYLIYRNYIRWHLPVAFLAAAWAVLAVAPIRLTGDGAAPFTLWWPLTAEGLDVGFTYINYQILSGEALLAAFFLATEMTSRPVTTGGQVIFGLGCGALAMLLKLYVDLPIPCYMAVLAMNTLTPAIDSLWRPRVLGMRRLFSGPAWRKD